jgi:hypothetical protein
VIPEGRSPQFGGRPQAGRAGFIALTDRAERQRLLAQAVLEKGLSKEILLHPATFNQLVSGRARQVKVDDGLNVAHAKDRDIEANATRQHWLVAGPDQGNPNVAGWAEHRGG